MKHAARITAIALVFAGGFTRGEESKEIASALQPLQDHVTRHRDGGVAWSVDFSQFREQNPDLPIGVFDSGIGGLTVMEAILKLDAFNNLTLQPGADGVPDFAGEKFIYLGDQANMPYGNYPAQGREDYLRELIVKDAVFLLGKRYHAGGTARSDKRPVKAIVIACNTATAYGLEDIRRALRAWNLDVPVIGVVEAGARAVSESLPSEGSGGTVAVLATVGTCSSGAYPRAIGSMTGPAGKSLPPVIQHGCVGLAGAIEGQPDFIQETGGTPRSRYRGPMTGSAEAPIDPSLAGAYQFDFSGGGMIGDAHEPATWRLNSVANYARYEVTTLVEKFRRQGGGTPISTVVLGCTHFPIAQRAIRDAFAGLRAYRDATGAQPYRDLIAGDLVFADPAEFTARELFRELARRRLRVSPAPALPPGLEGIFVSMPDPRAKAVKLADDGSLDAGYKYSRLPGNFAVEDTVVVPLAEVPSSVSSLGGLAGALPLVWRELKLPPGAGR